MEAHSESPIAAEKSLAYRLACSFTEYLQSTSVDRAWFEARRDEIRIAADDQLFFVTYPDSVYWLAVVAEDGPDTAATLPIVAQVCALSPRFELRVVTEERAADLLGVLLDDTSAPAALADADLPLYLTFDEEWTLQDQWGPHPQAIDPYLEQWSAEHPELDTLADDDSPAAQAAYLDLVARLTHAMRLWYNSGLTQACVQELRALLASIQTDDAAGDAED